ncbi:unnamed protein product [Mytilus edulis]|uniref:Uncharacterized protein n=1 Tax=Mytilus edulis TaxID=6550 RepID=A0A8S3RJ54_MYTED|nr:unnamed protein product [Mytilus edulis]
MENVLIVSVVKHSDKNNNKAYILKNTATQTKCRTFRELYQEAIERCSDAQSEIINIKTIQISKSNSFDDSSIEISDENMVWSICNDLNFKYVQFTIDDGSTATKDASNSKPSGINAFSVLMSSQNELHMPDKPVPLSGKQLTGPQRLYSDIIDWASNIDQGWSLDTLDTGKEVLSKLSSALWYIDHGHEKFAEKCCRIPECFQRFKGYNEYKKLRHKTPVITSEKLNDVCLSLTKCLSFPSMSLPRHTRLASKIEALLSCLTKYKEKLQLDNFRHKHVYQKRDQPCRSTSGDSTCQFINPTILVDKAFLELDKKT